MKRYLRVDPIACDGRGLCAELFPEWIALDDWGYPIVDRGPIPDQLLGSRAPRGRRVPEARAHAQGRATQSASARKP